jgi:hypothetical protein
VPSSPSSTSRCSGVFCFGSPIFQRIPIRAAAVTHLRCMVVQSSQSHSQHCTDMYIAFKTEEFAIKMFCIH